MKMEITLSKEEVRDAIQSWVSWHLMSGRKIDLITATDAAGYKMDFPILVVSLGDRKKEAIDGRQA